MSTIIASCRIPGLGVHRSVTIPSAEALQRDIRGKPGCVGRPSADYYNSPPGELPLWGSEKTKKSHRLLLQKARRPKPKLGLVWEAGCHSTHPRSRGASGLDSERHRRLFVESKELRLVDKPSSLRKRPLLAQARKRGIDAESTVLRNIKSMSSIFGGARYQEAPRRLSLEVRAKYGV